MNKRLRVSYSRKIQPAQFESLGLEVCIEKDVTDDEDLGEIASKTTAQLRQFVTTKLAESLAFEKSLKDKK